jgi:CRISPR system Cascade subunit CasA
LVCYGDILVADNGFRFEPLTAWRRSATREKAAKSTVYLPRSHDPSKALWRGLDALLPRGREGSGGEAPATLPPPVTEWMAQLANEDIVPRDFAIWAHAVGASYRTQSTIIEQIYDDRLSLPVEIFAAGEELRTTVVGAAADAEATARAVGNLGRNVARASGGSGDVLSAAAGRAEAQALSRLDQEFRDWLADIGEFDRAAARAGWQKRARRVAVELGKALGNAAGPAAWIGREIEKGEFLTTGLAEVWFRAALKKALPLAAPESHEATDRQEVMA